LAQGILSLHRPAWVAATLVALAPVCAVSLYAYRGMTMDPVDYGQFATSARKEIHSSDLVFVRKAWYATPILYYLNPDQYQIIGRNYQAALSKNPDASVWVVLLYDSAPPGEMQRALSGYQPVRSFTGPRAQATQYRRGAAAEAPNPIRSAKRLDTIGN
jgi:hypothetical protein